LPVKDLVWIRHAVIVHRKDTYLSPVARRFIEAMKAAAKTSVSGRESIRSKEGGSN